ncbi:MAG: Zn-ribbon domain-containing OB-fold protein [Promethearchaeota archaeon]
MVKLEYIKKEYEQTRQMPGNWYLSSYRYKFNITQFKPFLSALKEKKLIGLKCRSCNTVSFPPKLVCGKCLVRPDQWVPLRETGTVATFTINYIKNEKGEVTSFPVVAVRQDGADTTYLIELNPNIKFEDVYVGMPLKVKWKDKTEGKLSDIEYYESVEDSTKKMELLEEKE